MLLRYFVEVEPTKGEFHKDCEAIMSVQGGMPYRDGNNVHTVRGVAQLWAGRSYRC
jgi:hypothetical protein